MQEAFDFSKDVPDLKKRLWKRIQASMPATLLHELEDDDLEWVNAAGIPQQPPKDELPL